MARAGSVPTKTALLVGLCALMSACSTTDRHPVVASLFADHLFASPSHPVDEDIFESSEAMRLLVDERMESAGSRRSRQRVLVDLFQPNGPIKLQYETAVTRTAAEAFESGSANCLSLAVMAASLARLMDVPVQFNQVFVGTSWLRTSGLLLASGHVNVTVGGAQDRLSVAPISSPAAVIDFLPAEELRGQRSRPLSEDEVVALFLNNRAAEFLDANRLDDAYAWARRAVERRPTAVGLINTLGAIYLRRGALAEAIAALRYAQEIAPGNAHVLSNLVQALERNGQMELAETYRDRLRAVEAVAPYYHFDLGLAAMKSGDYLSAQQHFRRELDQGVDYHEVHFALGLTQAALGDFRAAGKAIAAAIESSGPGREHDLYRAKLSLIEERLER